MRDKGTPMTVTLQTPLRETGPTHELADDLLRGAEEISLFLFGKKQYRRKVYHLAETSRLPVFRLGSVLCARRSVLMMWIAEQEQRAIRGADASRNGFATVTNSTKE